MHSSLNYRIAIEIHDIDIREHNKERLVFRKIPYTLWIVGVIITLCALYLLYHVALASFGVIFEGYREG